MSPSIKRPQDSSSQPPRQRSSNWKSTKSETIWVFFAIFLSTFFLSGLLIAILPIPFLLVGDGVKILSTESNPITFGAFLTGVVALVGLYYLIEFDYESRFEAEAGEAIQNLLTIVILSVGIINIEWEYLAHLPYQVRKLNALEDAPPLGTLLVTLSKPSVLFLLTSTTLVFAICLIARDGLVLTPRSFRRLSRILSMDINKANTVLGTYRSAIPRFEQVGFKPLPHDRITKGVVSKVLLFLTPILSTLVTVAVFAIASHFFEPQTWRDEALPHSAYSWFATALIPAWYFLTAAGFVHKRYWASNGYLISRSQCIVLIVVTVTFAIPFAALAIYLGIAATISFVSILMIRFFLHISQIRLIKRLMSD